MRLVCLADTHLFHDEGFDVPDGDVLVHAGDLCRKGDLEELAEAARWLASLPHRRKVIIAGNHDWAFQREAVAARVLLRSRVPGVVYLEDEPAVVDGVRFWGSPWQPEFNGWAFNLPRGPELAKVWAKIPRNIDVLVTHGPPHGIGDRSGEDGDVRAGCADLRARVADVAPRLHLFGHIHQDGGFWNEGWTAFANVTTWECARPPTVIDIDRATVTPVSVPPRSRDER
jgi:3',5'-cyclic AMP phosphodiesterase CpdA